MNRQRAGLWAALVLGILVVVSLPWILNTFNPAPPATESSEAISEHQPLSDEDLTNQQRNKARAAVRELFGVSQGWFHAAWVEPACNGVVVHAEDLTRVGGVPTRLEFYWFDSKEQRVTEKLTAGDIDAKVIGHVEVEDLTQSRWSIVHTYSSHKNVYYLGISTKTLERAFIEFPDATCGLQPVLMLRHMITDEERRIDLFPHIAPNL